MKKRWSQFSTTFIACSLLFTVAITANEEEKEVRPVGTRISSQNERMDVREGRELFSKVYPNAHSDEEEQRYYQEAQQLSKEELLAKIEEKGNDVEAKEVIEKSFLSNTSHFGSCHHAHYITPLGDVIRLEDGSEWAVRYSDRNKTLDWYTTDLIVITSNHEWLSNFDYKLNNENTGATVRVNLISAPYYNGIYTHWIVAIDYLHKKICLEDGSVWSVSIWDDSELKRMALEDTIIIGTNDSWFMSTRPNILINVDTMEFVKARCEF